MALTLNTCMYHLTFYCKSDHLLLIVIVGSEFKAVIKVKAKNQALLTNTVYLSLSDRLQQRCRHECRERHAAKVKVAIKPGIL